MVFEVDMYRKRLYAKMSGYAMRKLLSKVADDAEQYCVKRNAGNYWKWDRLGVSSRCSEIGSY